MMTPWNMKGIWKKEKRHQIDTGTFVHHTILMKR